MILSIRLKNPIFLKHNVGVPPQTMTHLVKSAHSSSSSGETSRSNYKFNHVRPLRASLAHAVGTARPLTSIASQLRMVLYLNATELQTARDQGQLEGLQTVQAGHCDEISSKASRHDLNSLLTAHSRWP